MTDSADAPIYEHDLPLFTTQDGRTLSFNLIIEIDKEEQDISVYSMLYMDGKEISSASQSYEPYAGESPEQVQMELIDYWEDLGAKQLVQISNYAQEYAAIKQQKPDTDYVAAMIGHVSDMLIEEVDFQPAGAREWNNTPLSFSTIMHGFRYISKTQEDAPDLDRIERLLRSADAKYHALEKHLTQDIWRTLHDTETTEFELESLSAWEAHASDFAEEHREAIRDAVHTLMQSADHLLGDMNRAWFVSARALRQDGEITPRLRGSVGEVMSESIESLKAAIATFEDFAREHHLEEALPLVHDLLERGYTSDSGKPRRSLIQLAEQLSESVTTGRADIYIEKGLEGGTQERGI